MKKMKECMSLCKLGLGQCQSNGSGSAAGQRPGGLKAGKGTGGDPLGEGQRLSDSFRELVRVQGIAGDGPVDSEVEITDGQSSESQVSVREIHSDYAAVAEAALEQENIPISHRFHVKRYFQAIRPAE